MAVPNVNRSTTNVLLPAEVSDEIWAKAIEASAVMQLARRIKLPGAGKEFQTITGDPEASWVGEGAAKPVGVHTFGTKKMKGYKMSVIEPFSDEFRRDKRALYDECVSRLPKALGKKFDATVFGPASGKPGDNFDTLGACAAIDIETDVWGGLVTADATVAANDSLLNGWVLAPKAKTMLLNQKDTTGHPIFVSSVNNDRTVNYLMGSPTHFRKGVYLAGAAATASADGTPDQLGFAGDWTNALYGIVQEISISISDQATLKVGSDELHLWQNNMFAVRVEFEVGFIVKDTADFVKLVGKTPLKTG